MPFLIARDMQFTKAGLTVKFVADNFERKYDFGYPDLDSTLLWRGNEDGSKHFMLGSNYGFRRGGSWLDRSRRAGLRQKHGRTIQILRVEFVMVAGILPFASQKQRAAMQTAPRVHRARFMAAMRHRFYAIEELFRQNNSGLDADDLYLSCTENGPRRSNKTLDEVRICFDNESQEFTRCEVDAKDTCRRLKKVTVTRPK
jgi:hypothetical protein